MRNATAYVGVKSRRSVPHVQGICLRHMCAKSLDPTSLICTAYLHGISAPCLLTPYVRVKHGICAPCLLTPLCMCRCSFDGKNAMALNKGWSVDICTSKYVVCVQVCVLQVFPCVQVCVLQVFPCVASCAWCALSCLVRGLSVCCVPVVRGVVCTCLYVCVKETGIKSRPLHPYP